MLLHHSNPFSSFCTAARLAAPSRGTPKPQLPQHRRRRVATSPPVPKQRHSRRDPTTPRPVPLQPSGDGGGALHCRHFESCSGCSHEWNLDKPPVLDEATAFFADRGVADLSFHSGPIWEWRCRAKLAVRGTSAIPQIGLYEEGTHNVVDIPLCRAHHPSINAAVDLLRKGISILNVEPYNEDEGTGELRYVQMAVTTHNTSIPSAERYKKGRVQVTLVWNSRNEISPGSEKLQSLAEFMWRNGGPSSDMKLIQSVWANFQTSATNIIFGNKWRHLSGEVDFWEHLGGVDICLSPSSFGQANTQAFDSLLKKVQKYVPYGSSVVDLYAGAGIIGLSVAVTRKCRSVKCVEINKEGKLSFEKSLNRFPQTAESSISWHHADASVDSLHWIRGSDVIIVDPPRKGLDSSLIDMLLRLKSTIKGLGGSSHSSKEEKRPWILRKREASVHMSRKSHTEQSQTWPHTLIYISCGWESFKEDCNTLLSSETWHLENAHAFNFFPGTHSIEILAVFKRGAKTSPKKKKPGKKTPKGN